MARLRRAGAAFVGKTSTAEFGQSATTENRLLPDTGNPWDPGRTPAAPAAGSLRIPGAFTGLVGVKPSLSGCWDERGFRAMTDFQIPGPLARSTADARVMLEVLCDRQMPRGAAPRSRTVGWCRRPEGHPIHPAVVEKLGGGGRDPGTDGRRGGGV